MQCRQLTALSRVWDFGHSNTPLCALESVHELSMCAAQIQESWAGDEARNQLPCQRNAQRGPLSAWRPMHSVVQHAVLKDTSTGTVAAGAISGRVTVGEGIVALMT